MDRGVDAHRGAIRVLAGDPLVHLEEIAVALADRILPEAGNGTGKVEIDPSSTGADAEACVTRFLGRPRGDVTGRQIAVTRVFPLEVVVALGLGNVSRAAGVAGAPRHPDPAVVAERFRHQRQLRLIVATDRDAGRVDLGEAWVGERGAALVGPEGGGDVASLGFGREIEDVANNRPREHDVVCRVRLDRPGDHVAHHEPRAVRDDDEIEHLVAGVHGHGPSLATCRSGPDRRRSTAAGRSCPRA